MDTPCTKSGRTGCQSLEVDETPALIGRRVFSLVHVGAVLQAGQMLSAVLRGVGEALARGRDRGQATVDEPPALTRAVLVTGRERRGPRRRRRRFQTPAVADERSTRRHLDHQPTLVDVVTAGGQLDAPLTRVVAQTQTGTRRAQLAEAFHVRGRLDHGVRRRHVGQVPVERPAVAARLLLAQVVATDRQRLGLVAGRSVGDARLSVDEASQRVGERQLDEVAQVAVVADDESSLSSAHRHPRARHDTHRSTARPRPETFTKIIIISSLFFAFLKLTASSRPSAPPSDSSETPPHVHALKP